MQPLRAQNPGLYCSGFQRGVCIAAELLRRRGGEISLRSIALRASCAAIGFLSVPGRGCGARCSLRHRSNPSLGLAGLSPAHARDASSPLHGRCRHGFLRQAAVTIRGASAMPAPRLHPAPQALLCGAVLCHGNHARIRTEPTRRLWTRIGCGPFADHDDAPPARSTPEA